MNSPTSLKVWIGGALAAFIDGFIDGCPVGAPAGAGIAFADGQAPTSLAMDRHIAITALHILAVPCFSGLADLRAFKKDSPFPNVFAPSKPPGPSGASIVTEQTNA